MDLKDSIGKVVGVAGMGGAGLTKGVAKKRDEARVDE